MSKQLTLSAAFSTLAMAALAVVMGFDNAAQDDGARSATAHGSLVGVLLRA